MKSLRRMQKLWPRSGRLMFATTSALLVAGCGGGSNLPASVSGGEAKLIPHVEHAACGQTSYDQAILDKTVEAGVVAGHPRPLPRECPYEPVDIFAAPSGGKVEPVPVPRAKPEPPKKGKVRRVIDKWRGV